MDEIFSTMVGISLERIDEFEKNTDHNKIIIGAMILRGEHNQLITIESDFNSASFIISNMTGVLPEELLDDELVDGIQELVNIVAGLAKQKLELLGCGFLLTSPFAFKGNDVGFFTKKGIKIKTAFYKAEDAKLSLNIYDV